MPYDMPGNADRLEPDPSVAPVGERVPEIGIEAGRFLPLGEDTIRHSGGDGSGIAAPPKGWRGVDASDRRRVARTADDAGHRHRQVFDLVRFVAKIPAMTYAGNFAAHVFAQTPRGTRRA